VVNPALPVHSVADLVALANRTPGGLAYASNGHGGAGHLYAELLKSMTGIAMTHVPYKSVHGLRTASAGFVAARESPCAAALPSRMASYEPAHFRAHRQDRTGTKQQGPQWPEASAPSISKADPAASSCRSRASRTGSSSRLG
jgi:hypothetical protein